ncbi:MAG: DMT family transporter [Flavobacteriales bacterium]|nr:DMT family transporter [Flavobacteriales bacterium]
MTALLLSILFSTILVIFFKLFVRFNIHNLQAIVINYITAAITGMIVMPFSIQKAFESHWCIHTLILGIVFISIFLVMALTTQKAGMAVTSVAGKMSMVIPVMVGVIYFKEKLNFWQWIGLVIAILAVLAISYRKDKIKPSIWVILLPLVLFLGSGLIDSYLNIAQKLLIQEEEFVSFTSLIFLFAFISGFFVLFSQVIRTKKLPSLRSILAGVLLGIFNWGSLYFLLRALRFAEFPSAIIFAFNNIGIVITSSIIGILLFGENYRWVNYIGLVLSVLAIILLNGRI